MHSAETFTGFKWIGRTMLDHPELRFVLGYEQALGYLVADRPLDKDGISAAVLFAEIAAVAAAEGRTLQEWLDDIAARFGRHRLADASVRMTPAEAAAKVRGAPGRPAGRRSAAARCSTHRGVPARPTCCGSSSRAACACRSARAAPSRRSSSTARPSTRTRRPFVAALQALLD